MRRIAGICPVLLMALLPACGEESGPQGPSLEVSITTPTVLERDGVQECYYTVMARLEGAESARWLFGSSAHRSANGLESEERFSDEAGFQEAWGGVELQGLASRGVGRSVSLETPRVGWEALEAWMVLVGTDTLQAQARRQC
ncbi:MAG: hypothetical protein WEA09_14970 [Gemmatimonadota bacterium]